VVLLRWKLAETAWAKMSDVDDDYFSDFLQKLRDAIGDLLAKVATGELSRKDAERELHIMRAFCELISMVTEKWQDWPCPLEEGVRKQLAAVLRIKALRRLGCCALAVCGHGEGGREAGVALLSDS
jgi:hypothetical protein